MEKYLLRRGCWTRDSASRLSSERDEIGFHWKRGWKKFGKNFGIYLWFVRWNNGIIGSKLWNENWWKVKEAKRSFRSCRQEWITFQRIIARDYLRFLGGNCCSDRILGFIRGWNFTLSLTFHSKARLHRFLLRRRIQGKRNEEDNIEAYIFFRTFSSEEKIILCFTFYSSFTLSRAKNDPVRNARTKKNSEAIDRHLSAKKTRNFSKPCRPEFSSARRSKHAWKRDWMTRVNTDRWEAEDRGWQRNGRVGSGPISESISQASFSISRTFARASTLREGKGTERTRAGSGRRTSALFPFDTAFDSFKRSFNLRLK